MNKDLFSAAPAYQPLAARMRPRTPDDYIGQEHLFAKGKAIFATFWVLA